MTAYSASNIMAVNLSDAHGGCGSLHTRPVRNGAPDKIWKLDCVMCENHLRTDPLWSGTIAEIPETHNEKIEREDYEKRGANDIQTMMALALTRLTGGEVPDTVAKMIDGSQLHIPSEVKVLCPPFGHANPPGMKFCGECGTGMHEAAPAPQSLPAGEPGGREAPPASRIPAAPVRDLASLHPQKLRKMCRQEGLDDSGTRPEMLARLEAAGKVAV